MIRSLFEQDEEEIKKTKAAEENASDGESIEEIAKAIESASVETAQTETEKNSIETAENPAKEFPSEKIEQIETAEFVREIKQIEPIPTFQISEPSAEELAEANENFLEVPDYEAELEAKINQIHAQKSSANQPIIETVVPIENAENFVNQTDKSQTIFVSGDKKNYAASEPTFQFETQSETIRRTGLAFSAAITLFGAVAFMMIIGWFFDLIAGTSPWGIVGGVAFGALIGFIQFFRQTSQIFGKKN